MQFDFINLTDPIVIKLANQIKEKLTNGQQVKFSLEFITDKEAMNRIVENDLVDELPLDELKKLPPDQEAITINGDIQGQMYELLFLLGVAASKVPQIKHLFDTLFEANNYAENKSEKENNTLHLTTDECMLIVTALTYFLTSNLIKEQSNHTLELIQSCNVIVDKIKNYVDDK